MYASQADSEETRFLLEQGRTGDRRAFDELFRRHRSYLRRVVELRLDPRLRGRLDASDVVQETHLEALSRLDTYLARPALPFRLWLRQIACDRSLKARRYHLGAARRTLMRELQLPERSSAALAQQLLAESSTPSQEIEKRELARRLGDAVAQLSASDREIVLMRHFERLSNREAALLLGIDAAAASRRHGRAMLRLHRILFQGGLGDSAYP